MVFLDKYGYPVCTFRKRPVLNFLRYLIHTRKICRGTWDGWRVVPPGETSPGPSTCENTDQRNHEEC